MRHLLQKGLFWSLSFFLLTGCGDTEKEKPAVVVATSIDSTNIKKAFLSIESVKVDVRSGDLIFRTGRDYTSTLIRQISTGDKTYSHAGIASWEQDTLFVYHALGGDWNPGEKIRSDSFAFFCNPYENRGFAVYRYSMDRQQQKAMVSRAILFYREGIRFDMNFDLATDDKMYCSEFVYKSLHDIPGIRIEPTQRYLDKEILTVGDLYRDTACREIKRILFQ